MNNGKHGQGTHCIKMGADSLAQNSPNASRKTQPKMTDQAQRFEIFEKSSVSVSLHPQFYIQLLYTAPLCFTLTISDQKIVSGSLFFQLFSIFYIKMWFFKAFISSNFLMRSQKCFSNRIEKLHNNTFIKKNFFAHKKMKKVEKIGYHSRFFGRKSWV